MANDYYTHTTYPATGSQGSSASMRAELDLVDAGFSKLPSLSGNGGKFVLVNASGTGQTVSSVLTESGGAIDIQGATRVRSDLNVYGTGTDRLKVSPQAAGGGALVRAVNNADSAFSPLIMDGSSLLLYTAGAERGRFTSVGLGLGGVDPTNLLHLRAATNPVVRLESAAGDSGYIDYTTTRLNVSAGGGYIALVAGNAEQGRLTTTGLGIGTTATYKLDVLATAVSVANFKSTNANSAIVRVGDGTGDTGYLGSGASLLAGLARTDFGLTANAGGALVLGANNTERARIDASGLIVNATSRSGIGGGADNLAVNGTIGVTSQLNGAPGAGNALQIVNRSTTGRIEFYTNNASVVTTIDSPGNVYANADGVQTLGVTSRHWANVFSYGVQRDTAGDLTINAANAAGRVAIRAAGSEQLAASSSGVSVPGALTVGSISGPGSGLTSLNANNLTSGTVPNARTTASSGFGTNTIVSRDSNGDTALRGLVLQNTAVAGNVLDWYEEQSTFTTHALRFGGAGVGMLDTRAGSWTRIGNQLTFTLRIVMTDLGTSTGAATVTGLPYAPLRDTVVDVFVRDMTGLTGVVKGFIQAGTTTIDLYQTSSSGDFSTISNSNFLSSATIRVSGSLLI